MFIFLIHSFNHAFFMDRTVENDRKVWGGEAGMGLAKDHKSGLKLGSPGTVALYMSVH